MQYDKSDVDDRKVDNPWIYPKKSMPMTNFFKKSKKEEDNEKLNNKHSMLIDECEDNEDEDYEMKYDKISKDVASSDAKMNDHKKN